MDTVTTPTTERPAYGTVEYFAESLREECRDRDEVRNFGCLLIAAVADSSVVDMLTDAERLAYIRNALAAIDVVRAELATDR